MLNLIYYNEYRNPFNSVMYENSTVPEAQPGGGGFSVIKLTLEGLYDMHKRCQNWWTTSNDNLPLVRYSGATIKFYQSKFTDYVVKWSTCLPGTSTKITYPGLQPSLMLMSKKALIIPSLQTKRRRKPYKKLHIKPPEQLETKWYFQTDLVKTPLLTLYTSACSLNHYYTDPTWMSNNITLTHINTKIINNMNFKTVPSTGYPYWTQGTQNKYFYCTTQHTTHGQTKLQYQHLIPLTNTKQWTQGSSQFQNKETWSNYKTKWSLYAGNPFVTIHNEEITLLTSTTNPQTLFNGWTTKQDEEFTMTDKAFTILYDDIYLKTRYNPNRDQGTYQDQINEMYLVRNDQYSDATAPSDPKSLLTGYPIWISIYGFTDFCKKQNIIGVEEQNMLVFRTKCTQPIYNAPIIVIDADFIQSKSPFSNTVHPNDAEKWYPQVQYQHNEMNLIALCGPGTAKIDSHSDDIKCEYKMYFKWGGCPAKMIKIDDPALQDHYPIPSNDLQTTSLQNPAYPPEYYIYNFDERHHQITKTAAKRMRTDWDTKDSLLEFTETPKEVSAATFQQSPPTSEESDSEKEEETFYQQLLKQRQKQHILRHRIRQLMKQQQNLL